MLRRFLAPIAVLALVALALMTPAANAGTSTFTVAMSGFEDVPPGDPDGSGIARITINTDTNVVCYFLFVQGIAPANAAHIHIAPFGVAGPVVIPLSAPTTGRSSGCVTSAHADAIAANPANFYVNVHNTAYPAGAVRGQLA